MINKNNKKKNRFKKNKKKLNKNNLTINLILKNNNQIIQIVLLMLMRNIKIYIKNGRRNQIKRLLIILKMDYNNSLLINKQINQIII